MWFFNLSEKEIFQKKLDQFTQKQIEEENNKKLKKF